MDFIEGFQPTAPEMCSHDHSSRSEARVSTSVTDNDEDLRNTMLHNLAGICEELKTSYEDHESFESDETLLSRAKKLADLVLRPKLDFLEAVIPEQLQ